MHFDDLAMFNGACANTIVHILIKKNIAPMAKALCKKCSSKYNAMLLSFNVLVTISCLQIGLLELTQRYPWYSYVCVQIVLYTLVATGDEYFLIWT